jgi:hypothetical protein
VKFHRHIKKIDNLERSHVEILDTMDELYTLFPEKLSLNRAEIGAYFTKKYPSRDITYLMDVVDSALATDIGPEITLKLIEGVIEFQLAGKLSALAVPIISNQKTGGLYEGMNDILQEYSDLVTMADRPDQLQDCAISYEEAMKFRATDSGMPWPLTILNKCIGGIEPSLGLVIARPDVGKTSFMLNCMAYWASVLKDTGRQLLYCGNEEGIIGLKARCGVSLLGCDTEWAEQNTEAFGKQVMQRSGDCIRWHGGVKSTRDVETLVKRYDPVVTVLDQLPKFVLPGNKDEGVQGLANVYEWFRFKAKELGTAMFGVAQAGATAHNKQWLMDMDVNASKTDVPGELDWAIGIGFLLETGMENVRFINVFKNKQKYGRKGRAQVKFNPEKCRYYDK